MSPSQPTIFEQSIRADLHMHSSISDGQYTPETVVEKAIENGLQLIALTDHDSVRGISTARHRARELGCYFIDGVELETNVRDDDGQLNSVHILGYGIDPDNARLQNLMEQIQEHRVVRAREIVDKLSQNFNVDISIEAVLEQSAGDSLSRVHIAQVMKRDNHVEHIEDAFNHYLGIDCPAYVPRKAPPPTELIELIHYADGQAVWAHPYYSMKDELLEPLAEAGLDGIECRHSKFPEDVAQHYIGLADDYDLFVTGGSDFHGTLEEEFELGDWWWKPRQLPIKLSVGPGDIKLSNSKSA